MWTSIEAKWVCGRVFCQSKKISAFGCVFCRFDFDIGGEELFNKNIRQNKTV